MFLETFVVSGSFWRCLLVRCRFFGESSKVVLQEDVVSNSFDG